MANPFLSVLIKTYNEEDKILATIEAVIFALAQLNFESEIIIADSCSQDRTIEIAQCYPVRVIQFNNASDRGCGAGVQLGFQFARGDLVYFLDGDMQLQPDYLSEAIKVLMDDESLAGVAGCLEDTQITNGIDLIRAKKKLSATEGDVPHLNGGGLYKVSAIKAAGGYAGDRNLKAYEEADLGMRLRAAGYRLRRLESLAVKHTGHNMSTFALLARHWRSRRAMAAGVLLRGAIGKPWLPSVLWEQRFAIAVLSLWGATLVAALVLSSLVPFVALLFIFILALSGLAVKSASFSYPFISLYDWHYTAIALLLGLFYSRQSPTHLLLAHEIEWISVLSNKTSVLK